MNTRTRTISESFVGYVEVQCPVTSVSPHWCLIVVVVVYYESMKRDLKTRRIYECRCDERLKTKTEESTRHWVPPGTSTPKDRDEVNRRDVGSVMGEYVFLKT
jgi:hypothetical protein